MKFIVQRNQNDELTHYDPDQPRDEKGRWRKTSVPMSWKKKYDVSVRVERKKFKSDEPKDPIDVDWREINEKTKETTSNKKKTSSEATTSTTTKKTEEPTPKKNKEKEEQNGSVDKSQAAIAATQGIFGGIKDISNEASKLPVKKGSTEYGKYPDMSDQELNKVINRLNMEHRYSDLVGDTKYTKSGSEKTREVLQTIGAIAGIAGTLTGVIGAIVSMSKKKKTK